MREDAIAALFSAGLASGIIEGDRVSGVIDGSETSWDESKTNSSASVALFGCSEKSSGMGDSRESLVSFLIPGSWRNCVGVLVVTAAGIVDLADVIGVAGSDSGSG